MTKYLGQCDVVRRRSAEHEARWQRMMELAEPVSTAMFLRNVDLSSLLDDDETPEEYMRQAAADPTMRTCRSLWGDTRCWFLQTAGFEFIFVEEP